MSAGPYSPQELWDRRYLDLAEKISTWSMDPSTKVGAVLVNDANKVIATGFNDFPPDEPSTPELWADRAYKYAHVVHAELAALGSLYPERKHLPPGATLYTSFPPCPDCTRAALAFGIRRFVSRPLPTAGRSEAWKAEWRERLDETMGLILAADEVEFRVIGEAKRDE